MEEIEITIVNWEKYQNRKDIKHPHWFRLENRAYCSESLFAMNSCEKWVWVCLLSLASQKGTGELKFNKGWFLHEMDLKEQEFDIAVEKLARNVCVRVRTDSSRDITRQDITLHNTTEQNKKSAKPKMAGRVELAKPISPPTEKHSLDDLILNLSEESRTRLEKIYPDQEFVIREVEKMKVWLIANKTKSPKSRAGWSRFVMGWLERGWERHRKNIVSNKTNDPFRVLTKEELES